MSDHTEAVQDRVSFCYTNGVSCGMSKTEVSREGSGHSIQCAYYWLPPWLQNHRRWVASIFQISAQMVLTRTHKAALFAEYGKALVGIGAHKVMHLLLASNTTKRAVQDYLDIHGTPCEDPQSSASQPSSDSLQGLCRAS